MLTHTRLCIFLARPVTFCVCFSVILFFHSSRHLLYVFLVICVVFRSPRHWLGVILRSHCVFLRTPHHLLCVFSVVFQSFVTGCVFFWSFLLIFPRPVTHVYFFRLRVFFSQSLPLLIIFCFVRVYMVFHYSYHLCDFSLTPSLNCYVCFRRHCFGGLLDQKFSHRSQHH